MYPWHRPVQLDKQHTSNLAGWGLLPVPQSQGPLPGVGIYALSVYTDTLAERTPRRSPLDTASLTAVSCTAAQVNAIWCLDSRLQWSGLREQEPSGGSRQH